MTHRTPQFPLPPGSTIGVLGSGQLGRKLLAAAARQGREHGCRFIRLEVDHRNTGVEGFYEQLGFHRRTGDTIFILKPEDFEALASS